MLVYVLGGLKVMNGEFTIGMLVAYQTLVAQLHPPARQPGRPSAGMLQELQGDMTRLDDVLRLPGGPAVHASRDGRRRRGPARLKLTGKVELRDVTFGYSPLDPPLIEDFNLVINPGERVALVGGSGSGKSTVAKLVAGLYEPWTGQVLFDDVPRTELPRDLITNSLGVVDQDVFLFGGTITENVTHVGRDAARRADRHRLPRRRHRRGHRGARGALRRGARGGRART